MTAPEATAFEYAMGLFSVLIGLAVADIAISFHRLMRRRQTVRWDPLALAAAFYTLCMAVYMWFDIWGVRHVGATRHFFFYLGLVAQLFVLFLIAAASLPDEASDNLLDLRPYYATNRRYFWSLLVLFQVGYAAFGIYFSSDEIMRQSGPVAAYLWSLMTAPVVVSLVLLVVRSRIAHYIGLSLLFALMALHYAPMQIN
jgi:hypothetical protein